MTKKWLFFDTQKLDSGVGPRSWFQAVQNNTYPTVEMVLSVQISKITPPPFPESHTELQGEMRFGIQSIKMTPKWAQNVSQSGPKTSPKVGQKM